MNPGLQHWLLRQDRQERIDEAAGRRLVAEAHGDGKGGRADAAGGRVQLTQLQPSDGERLGRLFYRLSRQSVYRRFLSPIARLEQARADPSVGFAVCSGVCETSVPVNAFRRLADRD
jgi:hypothetical protein